MLRVFYNIRRELSDATPERDTRRIKGAITATPSNANRLQQLQDGGYITKAEQTDGTIVDFGNIVIPTAGLVINLTLNPVELCYYEDFDELLAYKNDEPDLYYVHTCGELSRSKDEVTEIVKHFRQMLEAKEFLRLAADLKAIDSVTFFAPEKLEIPFTCKASELRELPEVPKLCTELAENVVERDQRIVLFKKSLRDHLRMHTVETRFGLFLQNLHSIYDSYRRDYELWLGNTFADIKKNFEEKRLRFVADLNHCCNDCHNTDAKQL